MGVGALVLANVLFHVVIIAAAAVLSPFDAPSNLQSEESLAEREYAKHGGPGGPDVVVGSDEVSIDRRSGQRH